MAKCKVLYPVSIKSKDGVAVLHSRYGSEVDVDDKQNDIDTLVANGFLESLEAKKDSAETKADKSVEEAREQAEKTASQAGEQQAAQEEAEADDKPKPGKKRS